MSVHTWMHDRLFGDCEQSQLQVWKWLHEAQAENARLRADAAQGWWSPPSAPMPEPDQITYAGWHHAPQRDALDNEHTVVVRDGRRQQVLQPLSCGTWTAYPETEFSWGYGGEGPSALATSLLVHALGAKEVDAAFDKGFPLVGPFVDDYVRRWSGDGPWEISQAEIRAWAAKQVTRNANTPHAPEDETEANSMET